jgi:uncharacterized protein (DUF305 family)
MNLKLLVILAIILIFFNMINGEKLENFSNNNVCRGFLTDREYLEHMIPHHQVAVDVSIDLMKKTKSANMKEILRKLIYNQKMEIILMKTMIGYLPTNISTGFSKYFEPNRSDNIKPNVLGLSDTFCDPHFFDPEAHMEHMKHMKLDDKMYIHHMIPHHQVAVDMSKVLIKNTKNDFMLYLAYRIIRNQSAEIVYLNYLLNKSPFKNGFLTF